MSRDEGWCSDLTLGFLGFVLVACLSALATAGTTRIILGWFT